MLKRIGLTLAVAALLTPGYQRAESYRFENKTGAYADVNVLARSGPRIDVTIGTDNSIWTREGSKIAEAGGYLKAGPAFFEVPPCERTAGFGMMGIALCRGNRNVVSVAWDPKSPTSGGFVVTLTRGEHEPVQN